MARRTLFLLSLTVLFAGSILAAAQLASAAKVQAKTRPTQPTSSADSITLGQAAVPLYGPDSIG
jgi:hypothetical protein